MKMTVATLLAMLDGADPEMEVRLAVQPSYPFECEVAAINTVHTGQADIDQIQEDLASGTLTDEETVEARRCLEEARAKPEILYICQGSQIGYASRDLWNN